MSPVFDEAKYRALLEKLEVSIVSKTKILSSDSKFRVDAEFYQKKYIACERILNGMPSKGFSSFCYSIKKGIFDLSPEHYLKQGVPFVRTSEIKNPTIDFSTTVFLDEKTHQANTKTELQPYDIVFTKIGAYIGDVALLPPDYTMYNFSQNVAGARIKQKELSPYLLAFFRSTVGQNMIIRTSMLSGQGKLELDDIRNYRIPIFSEKFTHDIKILFENSIAIGSSSISKYKTAEQLLLQELGLMNWQPDEAAIATKTFADFQNSSRLDAEYYQPKYDDLFKRISSYDKSRLGDIVNITKSIEPGSEAYQEDGVPFVRVSDITKFGITPPEIHLDRDKYYSENLTPKKDTILLSKDGSVGIAYKVENDLDVITSGALLHLTVKNNDFLPDYLTLVLNSIVVKLQAERDAGGSIIQHWKPSEIENVVIPKLPMKTQEQIAAKVQESFALRKESKRLLDLAKYSVEVAIEQGEDAAIKLLEENI